MSLGYSSEGGVAVLTLDRPDALNALDRELLAALRERLRELADDASTRVVVLTGAGRAFAAGADIKEMAEMTVLQAREWSDFGQECCRLLETMRKPTIAAVNGFALGGGCELALACDLRYASETARLGQPEVNIGVIPGWGGTQRLARATTEGFAKELVLTGRMVEAPEALERGLVNAVYPAEELLERALAVARDLAGKSPVALAYAKEALNRALQGELGEELGHEALLFAALFGTEDQKEGMRAFTEKREPRFVGR